MRRKILGVSEIVSALAVIGVGAIIGGIVFFTYVENSL